MRLSIALAVAVVASLVVAPAMAKSKRGTKAAKRRTQVVKMDPIKARPMKPNVVVEIRKRRMALPIRGATGFVSRIGRRVPNAPF
jgi:hypothetical protein